MRVNARRYRVGHFFGGSGGGARGFKKARPRLFTSEARFECVGSIDFDAKACRDFERFTGSRTLCADIREVTPAMVRELMGEEAPHVLFMSPPCKGASRLITSAKAQTAKYREMNELALVGARLALDAWEVPPALILLENVPGLPTRAAKMVRELRALLRSRGYVVTEGFHCCGEIGGLAQRRKRYLLVARHPGRCAQILRKPVPRRVRGIGEVIGPLPMPATPAASAWGQLHTMPKLSWRNWVRLAMIPAGGDWRDLDNVLAAEQARREVFARHGVLAWDAPTGAVAGTGSNGVGAVADARLAHPEGTGAAWHRGAYGVRDWAVPAPAVTGGSDNPSRGAFTVADPRPHDGAGPQRGAYGVGAWDEPAAGVTGEPGPSNGRRAVADPRAALRLGVRTWEEPSPTVIGQSEIQTGAPSVGDPRAHAFAKAAGRHENKYAVRSWDEPAKTIIGKTQPGSGAQAIADERLAALQVRGAFDAGYAVLREDQPSRTVASTSPVGCGSYAVADSRPGRPIDLPVRRMTLDEALALDLPPNRPPPFVPVIEARDGTWHRPLTLLELAVLQSYPAEMNGEPIRFEGTRGEIAEHIGNSVPEDAAEAIGDIFGTALLQHDLEAFSLVGDVWVGPVSDRSDIELQ